MPTPCASCGKLTNLPQNVLLNCNQCLASWHHRCHKPPVSDKDLIRIIRAYQTEKTLQWKCAVCANASSKNRAATKSDPIVIDDNDDEDDEIIFLGHAPPAPHDQSPIVARPDSSQVQVRIIDDPFIDVVPPRKQKLEISKATTSLVSGFVDLTASSENKMPSVSQPISEISKATTSLVSDFVDLTVSQEMHQVRNVSQRLSEIPLLSLINKRGRDTRDIWERAAARANLVPRSRRKGKPRRSAPADDDDEAIAEIHFSFEGQAWLRGK